MRCLNVGIGSDAGTFGARLVSGGVCVGVPRPPTRPNFLASFLNGEIDLVRVPVRPLPSDDGVGKASLRFVPDDLEVRSDATEPVSPNSLSRVKRSFLTFSMSASVRAIRSLKFRQRCVDSACRRKHSPFFVTRS